jgi:hypothetical protein
MPALIADGRVPMNYCQHMQITLELKEGTKKVKDD